MESPGPQEALANPRRPSAKSTPISSAEVGANVLHVGGAFHAAVEVFGARAGTDGGVQAKKDRGAIRSAKGHRNSSIPGSHGFWNSPGLEPPTVSCFCGLWDP